MADSCLTKKLRNKIKLSIFRVYYPICPLYVCNVYPLSISYTHYHVQSCPSIWHQLFLNVLQYICVDVCIFTNIFTIYIVLITITNYEHCSFFMKSYTSKVIYCNVTYTVGLMYSYSAKWHLCHISKRYSHSWLMVNLFLYNVCYVGKQTLSIDSTIRETGKTFCPPCFDISHTKLTCLICSIYNDKKILQHKKITC